MPRPQALGSDIRPFTTATQAASNTSVNGKPVDTAMACSATRPPPKISAIATKPSKVHQNTRCGVGASILPPAAIVSITNEPESDEVTKKTITRIMPISDVMPVSGSITRGYQKKVNDGIDIGASAGATVTAAEAGTVAAITKSTDGVPILVIRHSGNLLTVYGGIDALSVEKGATVTRGQAIAKVRAGSPSFLHFEVRQGFDSVDPMSYLQ